MLFIIVKKEQMRYNCYSAIYTCTAILLPFYYRVEVTI